MSHLAESIEDTLTAKLVNVVIRCFNGVNPLVIDLNGGAKKDEKDTAAEKIQAASRGRSARGKAKELRRNSAQQAARLRRAESTVKSLMVKLEALQKELHELQESGG